MSNCYIFHEMFGGTHPYVVALKLIQNCPLKTSPLDFNLTALLKECGDIFAPLVCKHAKLSFTKGIFPEIFKIAKITPLLEKPGANTKNPVNYQSQYHQ